MSMSDFFSSLQEVDYSDIASWPKALKVIVTIMVGVVMLVAIFWYIYKPKLESYEAAVVEERALKVEFEEKQKLVVNLPAYEAQMVEIKNRFDSVLRQLPDKSEVPSLLTDISEAGLEQGLTFALFKPGKAQQKDFYIKLPVSIEAAGDYHQLSNFISSIANFQRIVSVGNFTVSRNSGRGKVGNQPLKLKANIDTYHYNETESAAKKGAVSRVRK